MVKCRGKGRTTAHSTTYKTHINHHLPLGKGKEGSGGLHRDSAACSGEWVCLATVPCPSLLYTCAAISAGEGQRMKIYMGGNIYL